MTKEIACEEPVLQNRFSTGSLGIHMKVIPWFYIIVLCFSPAYAEIEKEEFKSDIIHRYSSSLCSIEFINCIELEHRKCINFVENLVENCSFDPFYDAVSVRDIEQVKKNGRGFGMCVSKGLLLKAEISEEKALQCLGKLESAR